MAIDQKFFLDVISGKRQDGLANVTRGVLSAGEVFYSCGAKFKNWLYDQGLRKPHRVPVPVIAVGNLTTGGTGKTPTVAWLVKWLQEHGLRPAIVSRGYRSLDGASNDEKLLLDQLCSGVPHLQDRDRVAAARDVVNNFDCNVIVLDDGFQHRRLHRDVDLVVIDALQPWGYDRLLPRGLLREPVSGLRRASVILLTRTDQVSQSQITDIENRIAQITSAPIVQSQFRTTCLVNTRGETVSLDSIRDRRIFAFAAIGNPAGFRRTLISNGFSIDDQRFAAFPDHHHYSLQDLVVLEKAALRQNATCLLTTRKDLMKLNNNQIGGLPVWAIDIELNIADEADSIAEVLQSAMIAR